MSVVHDQDVSCLDAFSFAHNQHLGEESDVTGLGLESFCTIPSGAQHIGSRRAYVTLLPGIEVLDLFATSERGEIWKDGSAIPCLAPRDIKGWEFYGLLYPQPEGASTLRLNGTIELLVGRAAGKQVSPSILFAFVPAGYVHQGFNMDGTAVGRTRTKASRTSPPQGTQQAASNPAIRGRPVQLVERQCGNLDFGGRSTWARLVVLCPITVFRDATSMPDQVTWGLYVSPRSRTLILVNRERGRIDLQLAALFTVDMVFRRGSSLISAFSRLFDPLGTADAVPNCFRNLDPLEIHCGITNSLVVDHLNIEADGREDYRTYFGVRLPEFFLSNDSSNLCFLIPLEAQKHRAGTKGLNLAALRPAGLRDTPVWTLAGKFDESFKAALSQYRERSKPQVAKEITTVKGGLLHLLGFDDDKNWFKALGGCTEIAFAAAVPSPEAVPKLPPSPDFSKQQKEGIVGTGAASNSDGTSTMMVHSHSGASGVPHYSGAASSSVDGGSGGAFGGCGGPQRREIHDALSTDISLTSTLNHRSPLHVRVPDWQSGVGPGGTAS